MLRSGSELYPVFTQPQYWPNTQTNLKFFKLPNKTNSFQLNLSGFRSWPSLVMNGWLFCFLVFEYWRKARTFVQVQFSVFSPMICKSMPAVYFLRWFYALVGHDYHSASPNLHRFSNISAGIWTMIGDIVRG